MVNFVENYLTSLLCRRRTDFFFIVSTLSAKNDYNRLFISNKTVGSLLLGAKHLPMYQSEQYYNSNFHALEVEGRGYRRFCFKKTVGFQVLIFFLKGNINCLSSQHRKE